MDIEKLIERLRTESLYADKASLEIMDLCMDAATAIETLQIENQALRNAANGFKADLTRMTVERDAAVEDISSALAEVEGIRRGYGVDNANADAAFADLCGNYCAKCGNNCYKEAEDYRCKNFEWRGIKKED